MPDPIPSALPPDTSRRKLIAFGGAAALLLVMTFAFVSGGKKTAPEKDKEPDTAVGVLQDGPDLLVEGSVAPDDWFLNAPGGSVAVPGDSGHPPADAGPASAPVSSVVTGDNPAANPSAGGTPTHPPAGGTPNTTAGGTIATNTSSTPEKSAGTPPAPTTANPGISPAGVAAVPAASTPDSVPERTGASPKRPVSGGQTAPQPNRAPGGQSANVASNDLRGTAPPQAAAPGEAASAMPRPASGGPAESAARVESARNTPPTTALGTMSTPAAVTTSDVADERPAFVRPAVKRTGLIAQSRSLVTERQIQHARSSGTPAPDAARSPAMSAPSPPAPAVVPKHEAEDFARRTTEVLRQQGTLRPTQQVRLPRQQETANTRVWREEDTPATAEERRPFGLVVEDTAPAFTPEGIPLRTDIPDGTSPLEKTGADKPLWKRPE
ncbi:MAG: hypothetical protein HS117_10215 [Verrucomicrobiaceae bacterium]|nr:hypothetical protein [Verrucomicrobiaceae bacterium]